MADLVYKQVRAVIDERTTYICLHCAGQVQPVGAQFTTLAGRFDAPPFHRHCRDIIVPWIPGMVNTQRKKANRELQRRPKEKRDWRKYVDTVPPPDTQATPDDDFDTGDGNTTGIPTPLPDTAETRALIRDWRGRPGRKAQAVLHGHGGWDPEALGTAKALDAAMRPTDTPTTVYRAVRAADTADYVPGVTVVDKGYTAATTERNNLPGVSAGVIMQIVVPAGTLAVATGSMGEIILARGTGVVITGVVVGAGVSVIQGRAVQP